MQFIIKEKEEYIEKLCQEINKLKNEKNIYETNLSKKYFIDLGQIIYNLIIILFIKFFKV